MNIKHPALAKAAKECTRFDEAASELGYRSSAPGPDGGDRDDQGEQPRYGPIEHIEMIDVDPVEIDQYQNKLSDNIPDLTEAIEDAKSAIKDLEDDGDGEASAESIKEAKARLEELKVELARTEQPGRATRQHPRSARRGSRERGGEVH
ncbi:hypothetical protein EV191_1011423 [Tamaricihabitans halophyticus]|uniref:Uncharacterized protein n=1 Tax=Tamaricihabitans halophyticus TaxID=1262583 RepID=A0A4R2R613_9PSEU|nr:hypothetical protein [Tamaricihabitans halophyticus]TCP57467.1 hypothetical protein EV191_1011423 [Tamaricihabitans halophyticus]